MTGAVAAIADPPQMEEPTPIKAGVFVGIFIALWRMLAMSSETDIVHMIIGRDCFPVWRTILRSMPKPNKITAHCRTFFDTILMPGS